MDPKFRVILPPDLNPRKPSFTPPPGACDTHFHVFGPPHLFPYVDARRYTPPAAPIEHFFGMAKVVGIQRGVMVQPTVHRFDSASTLDAIAMGEGMRGMRQYGRKYWSTTRCGYFGFEPRARRMG